MPSPSSCRVRRRKVRPARSDNLRDQMEPDRARDACHRSRRRARSGDVDDESIGLDRSGPLRTTPADRAGHALRRHWPDSATSPSRTCPSSSWEFLEIIERQLKSTASRFQNTWGDGLYVVFDDVVTCAGFALHLLEELERFDFRSFGFKIGEDKKPGVRIGLHTGPIFEGHDAIIGRKNYFGSHVSRAARIEPVTAARLRLRQRAVRGRAGHGTRPRLRVRVPGPPAAGQGLRRLPALPTDVPDRERRCGGWTDA